MDDLSWTVQRKDLYILRHTQGEKQRRRQRERKRENTQRESTQRERADDPGFTHTHPASLYSGLTAAHLNGLEPLMR